MLMTRRGALAAAAALAIPGAARAADSAKFPFRVTRNRPWTVVAVEGAPPMPFLLDTGAGWYAITDKAAQDLKLTKVDHALAQGVVGRVDSAFYRVRRIMVGGVMEERDLYVSGLPNPLGGGLQGLVPAARVSVMGFDFDAQEISLTRSLTTPPDGYRALAMDLGVQLQGSADPLGVHARSTFAHDNLDLRPIVLAEFDGEPVKLLLDTGSDGGLTLLPAYVKKRGLWDHYARSVPAGMTTIAGQANARLVRAERLKLGNLVFANPVVTLGDPADADRTGGPLAAGIVGMEFLRRLNFIYDPVQRQVWIKPNSVIGDGYRYNRAGAEIEVVDGALRAVSVTEGGPAWRAGLRLGDQITGWRGSDGHEGLVWALTGAPGSTVEIQVSRAGKAELVSVTLEDRV